MKVGILDIDIYGPSVPTICLKEYTWQRFSCMVWPLTLIGYLVKVDNAIVWRDPIVSKALMQLLNETICPELDYLVLDMPAGIGDMQLTLAKIFQLPVRLW